MILRLKKLFFRDTKTQQVAQETTLPPLSSKACIEFNHMALKEISTQSFTIEQLNTLKVHNETIAMATLSNQLIITPLINDFIVFQKIANPQAFLDHVDDDFFEVMDASANGINRQEDKNCFDVLDYPDEKWTANDSYFVYNDTKDVIWNNESQRLIQCMNKLKTHYIWLSINKHMDTDIYIGAAFANTHIRTIN
jgi:hypothetical protein